VQGSEVQHTIIMERSEILNVPHRIEDSLIGRDVRIAHAPARPSAYKLMLGDHSQVGIP
jgi:glucose-1-phosphate thymidylyltransferase